MARADELRAASSRRVRIRIVTRHGDLDPGWIVVARIPWETGPEFEAQDGKGVRYVSLQDLDARAHELPRLVEEAAAEVEAAIAAAPPPPPRPSQEEAEFDAEAYEDLIERSYKAMASEGSRLAETSAASLSASGAAKAVAIAALKAACLAAVGAHGTS